MFHLGSTDHGRARLAFVIALLLLVPTTCSEQAGEAGATPEQAFFDWTQPAFSRSALEERRRGLSERLAASGGGVFLAPARDGFSDGETFRQLDDFLYFTGLELPNSVLAIEDGGRALLFVPEEDARFVSASRPNDFPGRPLRDDPGVAAATGFEVRPYGALDRQVESWVQEGRNLWLDAGRRGTDDPPDTDYVFTWTPGQALQFHLSRRHPGCHTRNARSLIALLRMRKSDEEIEILRRACRITADGIRAAASRIEPGVDERTLEGVLEAEFKRGGSPRRAFDSIIKSGPNSLWPWRILASHYERRNREMRGGELVILDVGCELDHYASDVGRTFPVSGKFDDEQRRLVVMATDVADAVIAAVRPGVTLSDLQRVAEEAIPAGERRYMQTGLFFGHHVGLDVGDPSLEEARLAPGMVFTVEPWYYNHDREVAVFVEDVVVVTEVGCEVLTRELPRGPDALEAMVGR